MKIRIEFDTAEYWLGFKRFWSRNPDLPIVLLLSFIFAAHMLQIAFPSDGSMIFDEAHYVPASVATMNGVAANAEHPPLSKIIAAGGIMLLGNNWFGWLVFT
jgi:dolichyl-phosphate-mannose--protein O-mannosyl transferase